VGYGRIRDQAIGEAEPGVLPVLRDGSLHDVGRLNDQLVVIQEELHATGDLRGSDAVHRVEDPDGFHEHEVRDPRSRLDEDLCGSHLRRVVTRHEAHEDVRINGAHGEP
jgi:hypothetical protein